MSVRTRIRLAVLTGLFVPSLLSLRADGSNDSPFLGVNTEPAAQSDGVRVTYVFPGSAAESMGIHVDDRIVLVNDVKISTSDELSAELRNENVGARVRMRVVRAGKSLQITGKLGSRVKTFQDFQERMRESLIGKPLPPLPAVVWWKGAGKAWESSRDGLRPRQGHLSIVFSFDDCSVCRERRLKRFAVMSTLLKGNPGGEIVDFRGFYFKENEPLEASLKAAQELFEATKPEFPVGVAHYGEASLTPASRLQNVVLHQHGVAVLDTEGKVAYLQVYGLPETEFYNAFSKLLTTAAAQHAEDKGADPGASEQG